MNYLLGSHVTSEIVLLRRHILWYIFSLSRRFLDCEMNLSEIGSCFWHSLIDDLSPISVQLSYRV